MHNRNKIAIVMWFILIFMVVISTERYSKIDILVKIEAKEVIVKDSLPELTRDNVLKEICKLNIKYPLIVMKQVILETGNLQCKNCTLDNFNLFGFTTDGKHYLKFNHWTESVAFYYRWQIKYYKERDYYQFLEDIGYATEKTYVIRLKGICL